MSRIDAAFPVRARGPIPADHGSALFAALVQASPELRAVRQLAVHPIRGKPAGGTIELVPSSRITLRIPPERLASLKRLAGCGLNLDGTSLRLGRPTPAPLCPAHILRSRLVILGSRGTVAGEPSEREFLAAIRDHLKVLRVSNQVAAATGRRRSIQTEQGELTGFEVILVGLSREESLLVQSHGLGKGQHFGCGVFLGAGEPAEPGRVVHCHSQDFGLKRSAGTR